jgi:hypothetical protein
MGREKRVGWEDHEAPPGHPNAERGSRAKYWDWSELVWKDQGTPVGNNAVGGGNAVYQPTLDRIVIFVTVTTVICMTSMSAWTWEDQGLPVEVNGTGISGERVM